MRFLCASLLLLAGATLVSDFALAQDKTGDKKEVTLKGKIACGKCELNVDAECATVIVVTQDKKSVVYYFDSKGHEKHHDSICANAKKGSVTGVVSEANKKKVITVKSVTFE